MKRWLIMFIIPGILLLTFCGCKSNYVHTQDNGNADSYKEMSDNAKGNETTEETIRFESGTGYSQYWEENPFSPEGTPVPGVHYPDNLVPDQEAAIELATAIFNIHQREYPKTEPYIPQYVLYDEEKEYWIVAFGKKYDGEGIRIGGNINIVLQKSDGKVVVIFADE